MPRCLRSQQQCAPLRCTLMHWQAGQAEAVTQDSTCCHFVTANTCMHGWAAESKGSDSDAAGIIGPLPKFRPRSGCLAAAAQNEHTRAALQHSRSCLGRRPARLHSATQGFLGVAQHPVD